MKKYLPKIILGLFLLFLLWRIALLIFRDSGADSRKLQRPAVAVEIDSIKYGPIQEIREFTGTVYPRYQFIIAPKVSGRIIEVRKRIGDWVRKGEIIARIDDAEYQQAVLEAEANLKISQATLNETRSQFELAKQERDRAQSLQEKGIASSAELDAALSQYSAQESRIKLAQAQVEQREAALNSSKIRLGYTLLSAAKQGFIGERFVDEGTLLAPNASVATVIGIDTVLVRTTIIERVYGRIKIGQPTQVVVDAFPTKIFTGHVYRIAPMLQEASRMAQMEVEVLNDSLLLKPGMFTRVSVVLDEKVSTQVVPTQAVVNREGKPGIYLVDKNENKVKFIEIQPGIISPELTEILSPEIKGTVVTLGQHLLEDGSNVLLPGQKSGAGAPSEKRGSKTGDQSGPPKQRDSKN
ncbi:efflux RND transporter periplasmic adaptor subunit [candidate division KSB1 bacterium]|nr:efflux RND transporter periplasmic adaptor subunit [candidate division KSB1 bacterium]